MVVIIHSVTRDCVADTLDYKWIQKHLNEELHVFSINYTYDGDISWIVVHKDENTILTLFNYRGLEFTL